MNIERLMKVMEVDPIELTTDQVATLLEDIANDREASIKTDAAKDFYDRMKRFIHALASVDIGKSS